MPFTSRAARASRSCSTAAERCPPRRGCIARSCVRSSARATAPRAAGWWSRARASCSSPRGAAFWPERKGYESPVASLPLTASVRRRRRRVALGAGLGVLVVLAAGTLLLTGGGDDKPAASGKRQARAAPPPPPQLPRGGRILLPRNRIVAFYGAPQDDELGELGIGSPASAARRLIRQSRPYRRKTRPVLPAMELIAVVASYAPGPGDRYSTRQEAKVVRRYLRAARRAKALLILDIQPGRSDFFTETLRLRKWLKEPDVGLALDPEWRMAPGQVPGKGIGSVGSPGGHATSAWLGQPPGRAQPPPQPFLLPP